MMCFWRQRAKLLFKGKPVLEGKLAEMAGTTYVIECAAYQ